MKITGIFIRGKVAAAQLRQIGSPDFKGRSLILSQILFGLVIAVIFILLGYFFPVHF